MADTRQSLEKAHHGLATAEEQFQKPFDYAEKIKDSLLELASINSQLDLDKKQDEVIVDENENEGDDENGNEDEFDIEIEDEEDCEMAI